MELNNFCNYGVKGYKVFNPDWTCRSFQYEVGKTYTEEKELEVCKIGFHFCKKLADCFYYYPFSPKNKVAEVLALGEVVEEGDKCITNKMKIVKELSWFEVLWMINGGEGCTGIGNAGNNNSGNRNSGNRNSGHSNGGCYNSGDNNGGNFNSGDNNRGDFNSGNFNSGNWNSGDNNGGNFNSGDWNLTSYSSGCFNTEPQKIRLFDEETDITMAEWRDTTANRILCSMPTHEIKWTPSQDMTEEEKIKHPEHKTTGGFLREYNLTHTRNDWWRGLAEDKKEEIRSIPNFNAEKFYQITGIDTEGEGE